MEHTKNRRTPDDDDGEDHKHSKEPRTDPLAFEYKTADPEPFSGFPGTQSEARSRLQEVLLIHSISTNCFRCTQTSLWLQQDTTRLGKGRAEIGGNQMQFI